MNRGAIGAPFVLPFSDPEAADQLLKASGLLLFAICRALCWAASPRRYDAEQSTAGSVLGRTKRQRPADQALSALASCLLDRSFSIFSISLSNA